MTRPSRSKRNKAGWFAAIGVLIGLWLQACATVQQAPPRTPVPAPAAKAIGQPKPYKVLGAWYYPISDARGFEEEGIASWYGKQFHGRKTSNGEIYDMYGISAAHKTLPLGTYVRVHNLTNDRTLDLRINDRGPFVNGRIIDLSYSAAKALGVLGPGTAPVKIAALGAPVDPNAPGQPTQYMPLDYYTGNFTFQVGAFTERANAQRLVQKLSQQYENAHTVPYFDGNQTFYRVRVGRSASLEAAEQYERMLAQNGYPGVFIVAE
jgi:rare lipoprotein A